ncbi:MAG: hypothetical protein ABSC94_12725 [Polyangiaceae bacterium]|jgi:hypothetical protein
MGCRSRAFGVAAAAIPLSLVVVAGESHAQPGGSSEKITAEALFEDGRRLVAEGKVAEACPKFMASEKLDPSLGTLLNLANCLEKQGLLASAWASYREAASAADAAGRKDYVATAERHADALAPRLARLTVIVERPTEGLLVKRDGVVVDRAEWGLAIPVDTGSHTIEASAPAHKGWATAVAVGQEGAQAKVTVPLLEAVPEQLVQQPSPPPAVAPPLAALPGLVTPPPAEQRSPSQVQRVIGWAVGGVGVVVLATGGALAAVAKSKYNESLANCESTNADLCSATGVSQRDGALSAGNAATIALGVGAAALIGGVVVVLTAPRGSRAAFLVGPTVGGAALGGTW